MSCPFHKKSCPYRSSRTCPFQRKAADNSRIIEDLYDRHLIDTIERVNQKDRMIQKHGLQIAPKVLDIKKRQADALYDVGLIDSVSRDIRKQFKTYPDDIKSFGESIGLVTEVMCVDGVCKEISYAITAENGDGPVSKKLKKTIKDSKRKSRKRSRKRSRRKSKRKSRKR